MIEKIFFDIKNKKKLMFLSISQVQHPGSTPKKAKVLNLGA